MTEATFLSNGRYHVMVMAEGSGDSRWQDIAVTRWREDSALDDCGTFLFVRDDETQQVRQIGARPIGGDDLSANLAFQDGAAVLTRRDDELATVLTVAVDAAHDIELRRLRITNFAARRRRLSLTSYAEIVLAPAATDSAHPAFSKLFVETSVEPALGAIFATRRQSDAGEPRRWCFHSVRPHVAAGCEVARAASFQTDRMRFIGRGRSLAQAQALNDAAPLSGQAGAVLDAIAAIRVPLELMPDATCVVDWFTGIAPSRTEAKALARRCREDVAGERLLRGAGACREATLRRIGASTADGLIYERLAGALRVADPALRGDASAIARNERGQSSLWGFGISGDVPVVLVEIANVAQIDLVQQFVSAHAFWQAHGVSAELMIVCAEGSATPALLAVVQAALAAGPGADVIGKPGGIFVRDGARLDDGDRTLLRSVARIAASGSWPEWVKRLAPGRPHARSCAASGQGAANPVRRQVDPLAGNGHGDFAADLTEYAIRTTAAEPTPAPWTNVIANAEFGTIVSESGSASTWSQNAHEFRLTPWSNDPVSDPSGEAFYLRDEASGRVWSPTLLPTRSEGEFITRHGFGYSVFEHEEDGIASTLRVHVATDSPVKFSALTLRNRSAEVRRLAVTGYVEWVLGDERGKTLLHVVTETDAESGVIYARNGYQTDFAGRTAFLDADIDDDDPAGEGRATRTADRSRSATGDRLDFFGVGGSRAAPAALSRAQWAGRFGAALDPCAALRVSVDLAPGQAREVTFRLGAAKTAAEARELAARWRGAASAHASFAAVQERWRRTLGAVSVRTPDPAVNALANGWLVYQVLASRLWGRTAFYQSSGAYGFRDQLQDVMALVHAQPSLVRAQIALCAGRQFVEGDVQHWWHPPSG
ncbi:MAG TPA: cyclic beta 1-2 glucan synthetase, partial [Caldimonas sp.]|nr:cyclic beta 1-2 glucan synthetase [Caldimonas sp.]